MGSSLRTPLAAGCELIVRKPSLFILASSGAMAEVSPETGWSDHGNADSFFLQNWLNNAETSLNVLGSPQSFKASSFYRSRRTIRPICEKGGDGAYRLLQ